MKKENKNKVKLEDYRYGLFMTESSYELDVMYGRHYLDRDFNDNILLRKVHIIKTKTDDLYGQTKAKNKSYQEPISIKGLVLINDSVQTTYGSENGVVRDDTGTLEFTVYLQELEEKNIDFDRGDIIEYNMSGNKSRFYEVFNSNKITDTTNQTIGSFKPYYKKIIATPVKEDVARFF